MTELEQLKTIVDFVNTDLTVAKVAGLRELERELRTILGGDEEDWKIVPDGESRFSRQTLRRRLLLQLQKNAYRLLDGVAYVEEEWRDGVVAETDRTRGRYLVTVHTAWRLRLGDDGLMQYASEGHAYDQMSRQLLELLKRHPNKVLRCPESLCGHRFLVQRTRKNVTCSTECKSRRNMRKSRHENADGVPKKRGRPRRAVNLVSTGGVKSGAPGRN